MRVACGWVSNRAVMGTARKNSVHVRVRDRQRTCKTVYYIQALFCWRPDAGSCGLKQAQTLSFIHLFCGPRLIACSASINPNTAVTLRRHQKIPPCESGVFNPLCASEAIL